MSQFAHDHALEWATAVTTTAETDSSAEFLIGTNSKLCAVLVATAATAAASFTMIITASTTTGGTFNEIARGVVVGPTGGGARTLKVDFSISTGYKYVIITVTAPGGATIVYSGWISDDTTTKILNQACAVTL